MKGFISVEFWHGAKPSYDHGPETVIDIPDLAPNLIREPNHHYHPDSGEPQMFTCTGQRAFNLVVDGETVRARATLAFAVPAGRYVSTWYDGRVQVYLGQQSAERPGIK